MKIIASCKGETFFETQCIDDKANALVSLPRCASGRHHRAERGVGWEYRPHSCQRVICATPSDDASVMCDFSKPFRPTYCSYGVLDKIR